MLCISMTYNCQSFLKILEYCVYNFLYQILRLEQLSQNYSCEYKTVSFLFIPSVLP